MSEPLSIATAVVGFLTASVALRNALAKVIEDVDRVKYDHERLITTGVRLAYITDRVSHWQELWGVSDGTPQSLLIDYWGTEDHNLIRVLLTMIFEKTKTMNDNFSRKHGNVLSFPPRGRESGNISVGRTKILSDVDELKNLEHLVALHKKKRTLVSRTISALLTGPVDEQHLKFLEDSVVELQTMSKASFINKHTYAKESNWEDHISSVQGQHHLLHIAREYSNASAILRGFIIDSRYSPLELQLDHGVAASQRIEHLGKVVGQGFFGYPLCLGSPKSRRQKRISFLCKMPMNRDDRVLEQLLRPHFENFLDYAEQVMTGRCTARVADLSTESISSSYPLILEPSYQDTGHDTMTEMECLRTFVAKRMIKPDVSLHGDFGRKERIGLAYELAEWTLLFLKTKWFSNICSCCIFRFEDASLKTTYRARVRLAKHVPPDIEDMQQQQHRQWCEEEVLGKHIRRLGILLLEVATGEPVRDIAWHPRKGIQVDGPLNVADPGTTPIHNAKAINRKINMAMGRDYMEVVRYCFDQDIGPDDISDSHMIGFYENVVRP